MSIQELVANKSIRFFNFDGSGRDLNAVLDWEIDDETMDLSLVRQTELRASQLEALFASGKFQNLMQEFTPDLPLWIGITSASGVAEADRLPDGASITGGLMVVSDEYEYGFVDQNGDVQEFTIERLLAHEMNHAAIGSRDTRAVLDGNAPNFTPNPDYAGETVEAENLIMFEAFGSTSNRTTYSSPAKLSFLSQLQNWTTSQIDQTIQTVDWVHVAKVAPEGSNDTQPGFNINTSQNTEELRDLIIYRDNPGDPQDNTIMSGAGNDFIYAGQGIDNVFGGGDDDHIFGEAGDDVLRGGSGNDYIDGGDGDRDIVDYRGNESDSKGEITGGITAVMTASEFEIVDGWGDIDIVVGTEIVLGTSLNDLFSVSISLADWEILAINSLDGDDTVEAAEISGSYDGGENSTGRPDCDTLSYAGALLHKSSEGIHVANPA